MRNRVLDSDAPVRRVARGGIAAFAIYVAGAGLTYFSQLAIARIVGTTSYGIYAYVFAWMTVLAYVAALGFDVSLLRFVPAYQAQRAWALLRGVIQYAERRVMAVGVGTVLIGISVIALWGGKPAPERTNTFLVGFALVPVWALLWIRSSAVRAFGGVVSALAPDRILRDGLLLGLIGLASLGLKWPIDATLAMSATVIGSVTGLGLVTLAMRRLQPRAADNISAVYAAHTWRRTALPLMIIAAAEVLMNRTGVLLLGWMEDARDAGVYALAFNIAFLTVLPRTAVNALLAPSVSDLFVRNDHAKLQIVTAKAALWTLFGAACIAPTLSLLANPLLAWFGHDFGTGVTATRILLVGQVIATGAGSQLQLMTMTGHERGAAVLLTSSATANALLSAVLIRRFGLTGAAIATAATLIVLNVAMALFVWRHLRILPGVLAMLRPPRGLKTGIAGH